MERISRWDRDGLPVSGKQHRMEGTRPPGAARGNEIKRWGHGLTFHSFPSIAGSNSKREIGEWNSIEIFYKRQAVLEGAWDSRDEYEISIRFETGEKREKDCDYKR
jgi:hypothetical protein